MIFTKFPVLFSWSLQRFKNTSDKKKIAESWEKFSNQVKSVDWINRRIQEQLKTKSLSFPFFLLSYLSLDKC